MGRGQYDRSAVRKPAVVGPSLVAQTAWMPQTDELTETKRQLAAALERIKRLERLCQTHGLWIDG